MSLAREFHTWVNAQSWVPGVINWNVVRPKKSDPWFLMEMISTDRERTGFCQSDAGESTIQITIYGSQRYEPFEIADKLRMDIVSNLRGALPVHSVWLVKSDGPDSSGAIENQINEYSFNVLITWELKN